MSFVIGILFLFCFGEFTYGCPFPLSELNAECVLWDGNCTGNRTQAMGQFFIDAELELQFDDCFVQPSSDCSQDGSLATALAYQKVRDWMRSPSCLSDRSEFLSVYHISPRLGRDFCCDQCFLYGDDVDVYYWPEPDADTSCLSLIGTDINPPDLGATTDSEGGEGTYWDCSTSSTPGEFYFPVKTATITTIGSLTFKATLRDPWSSPLSCIGTTPTSENLDKLGSVFARGHSLIVPPSETQNNGRRATTVVTDGFIFTYPSIYANFHGIRAQDSCGLRTPTISSTMLSFSLGELSTIAGPLGDGPGSFATSQFNFADLPCPPKTVMEANWYKPAPGEPYRPLIALPAQIKELYPAFKTCQDLSFTAFDPPRTLVPAAALVPDITTQNIELSSMTAMPSATHDPVAIKTATVSTMSPTLAMNTATVQLPQTQEAVPHPATHKAPPETSSSGKEKSQIASNDDPHDPDDGPAPYHSIGETLRQSNDPEKPNHLIEAAGFHASLPVPNQSYTPKHVLNPTPPQSQIVPQFAGSYKATPQHGALPASLLSLPDASPLHTDSGEQDSSPKAPRFTRGSEKPGEHQVLSLPRPTTIPASAVAGTATAPLPNSTSIYRGIVGPFANPTPALDPNVAGIEFHPDLVPTSPSLDTTITKLSNNVTTLAIGNISVTPSDSAQSVAQDSSHLLRKPTSRVQNGTNATTEGFRGDGAKLGVRKFSVLASVAMIMVVIAFG